MCLISQLTLLSLMNTSNNNVFQYWPAELLLYVLNVSSSLILQSAIFNFQSLLTVILLLICTCAYIRALAPSLLDKNKTGYDHTSLENLTVKKLLSVVPAREKTKTSLLCCIFFFFGTGHILFPLVLWWFLKSSWTLTSYVRIWLVLVSNTCPMKYSVTFTYVWLG